MISKDTIVVTEEVVELKKQIGEVAESAKHYYQENFSCLTSRNRLIDKLISSGFVARSDKRFVLNTGFANKSWISIYVEFGKKGAANIDINYMTIADGTLMPASQEKKHFQKFVLDISE